MSLRPTVSGDVPISIATVARAAFPQDNPYLRLRDHLGTIFTTPSSRRSSPIADNRRNAHGSWRW
jgi:hypothetical protein